MRTIARLAAGLALAAAAGIACAQVAVTVGQPGFYGSIILGSAPPPRLIYAQPLVVQAPLAPMDPIYLYVPAEQHRHWREYCGRYQACNRPVYFVDHDWYQRVYVPHYRGHRGEYGWHEDRRDDGRHEGWGHGHRGEGDRR